MAQQVVRAGLALAGRAGEAPGMAARCFVNPRRGTPGTVVLPAGGFRRAKAAIMQWPGYAPTPLRELPALAASCGVERLALKDEGGRFGFGSVQALGGAYAVADLLQAELSRRGTAASASVADLLRRRYDTAGVTFCSALDGQHGRSVAWGARMFGAVAQVFVPASAGRGRIAAVAGEGAEVHVVEGSDDDATCAAAAAAEQVGWRLVSDTSWPGYTEVPRLIMQGYRVMADEALGQWGAEWGGAPPTHVFVQGGAGGLPAAVSAQLRAWAAPGMPPALVVVEPERNARLQAAAQAGEARVGPGALDGMGAGPASGGPCLLAWQELERAAAAFVTITDADATEAVRRLAAAGVGASERGATAFAALLASDRPMREALDLGPQSRVLLVNTEGASDPEPIARPIG